MRGGFMHVPYSPQQTVNLADAPSMSIENIAKGIEAAISAIVYNDTDIRAVGGKEF